MFSRRTVRAFARAIIIGFVVGALLAAYNVLSNRYVHHGMWRLTVLALRNYLCKWILILTLCFVVWKVTVFAAWRVLSSRPIEKRVKDPMALTAYFSAFLPCFAFFLYAGWMFNYYCLLPRFHLLSLAGDASILVVTVLLGWVILRIERADVTVNKRPRFAIPMALTALALLAFLSIGLAIDRRISPPGGPNVVLVVVDTFRADHAGCYGYERNTTPHIDALASDGILFRKAIASASWTLPSIGTIMTSQYPAVLGIEGPDVIIGNRFLFLAELLREKNYLTKGIVSHHLVSARLGFGQGFDSLDMENAQGHDHTSSPSLTEKAISFLTAANDEPFFLFLHYFDPHYDYILHDDYDFYPDYDGPPYNGMSILELKRHVPDMAEDDLAYVRALYDSELAFTDAHIGSIFDELRNLGMYDNSLIIVTGDHGEEFAERGEYWIGHCRTLYQELIHVPLIIKLPGSHKAVVVEEYVGLIDLMPTIMEFLSIEMPAGYEHQGQAFDLENPKGLDGRRIISETKRLATKQSVMLNGWKLIRDLEKGSAELFDLDEDPRERNNRVFENEEMFANMDALLRQWNADVEARRSKAGARKAVFTKEQREQLRSFGYIK